ncbi:Phage tail tube protein, TTP [Azotobacter beijerinckii]|uniref:Phage tail tube protein, TTP n=1 Tax=Azotobacter beijerinckii TaxID=170623 RepID=A0A1H6Y371_9GAMM|nr:phage tail tube protein [Azotobacter beijerinckii]SEJ31602.1 Phage tail tube protein, TTP [Azotobacter beijerinckii]
MARKSRAVSSQGTRFFIQQAAAAGTPVTLTGISKAAKAVLTFASHSFVVGDVLTIAGVTGMTQINGLSGVVGAVTTTTVTLENIDSSGFTAYTSGGTATPVTFIETDQHKSYSGFDGQASEIDTTTLVSEAREKSLGLQDFGGMSVDLHYVEDDAFQVEAKVAKADGEPRWFRLIKKNGYRKLWQGYVRSLSDAGAVDGTNAGSLSVTITGAVYEVK